MPPRLRAREMLKKPNIKRPGSSSEKKKKFDKRPKPRYMPYKVRDLPHYSDDDDDFVKSDAESASSVLLSSSSEEEEEEKIKKAPKRSPEPEKNFMQRADSLMSNQSKLIDTLLKTIELKDHLLKAKDDTIAAKTAETERLQRMVRSLELQ